MGVFIAVIIILVLVLYAVKDLLAEKDFASWINIALTSLVLFEIARKKISGDSDIDYLIAK